MCLRMIAPFLPSTRALSCTAVGAALGELDQQLLEQLGHSVVDVLRAIVGMKPQNPKGKLVQDRFQHRQQMAAR